MKIVKAIGERLPEITFDYMPQDRMIAEVEAEKGEEDDASKVG